MDKLNNAIALGFENAFVKSRMARAENKNELKPKWKKGSATAFKLESFLKNTLKTKLMKEEEIEYDEDGKVITKTTKLRRIIDENVGRYLCHNPM